MRNCIVPAENGWRVEFKDDAGVKYLTRVVAWHIELDDEDGQYFGSPLVVDPNGQGVMSIQEIYDNYFFHKNGERIFHVEDEKGRE